jgi:hypothetical protein
LIGGGPGDRLAEIGCDRAGCPATIRDEWGSSARSPAACWRAAAVGFGSPAPVAGGPDGFGRRVAVSQTHQFRHTRATSLLNAGVPLHVVMRYFGHASPTMTMHYARTLSETAEAEFLRFRKVTADGRELAIAPSDLFDMLHLSQRADRVLPNGWCMLPPKQACDRGNAPLTELSPGIGQVALLGGVPLACPLDRIGGRSAASCPAWSCPTRVGDRRSVGAVPPARRQRGGGGRLPLTAGSAWPPRWSSAVRSCPVRAGAASVRALTRGVLDLRVRQLLRIPRWRRRRVGRPRWTALPGLAWLVLPVALLAGMPTLLGAGIDRSFTFWQLCLAMPDAMILIGAWALSGTVLAAGRIVALARAPVERGFRSTLSSAG